MISLSLILTFTPVPVHAEVLGDNGQNTVVSSKSGLYPGSGWSNNRQGYRFYIVNGDKKRVSDVVDFVFEPTSNINMNQGFTNARWESPKTDSNQWHLYLIDQLVEMCKNGGAVNPDGIKDIYPIKILKSVHGSEFQEWFIGKLGEGGGGGSANIDLGPSTGGGKTSSNPPLGPQTDGPVTYIDDKITNVNTEGVTLSRVSSMNVEKAGLDKVSEEVAKKYLLEVGLLFEKRYKY